MGAIIMAVFDAVINGIITIGAKVIDVFVSPIVGAAFSFISDDLYNLEEKRKKAEYLAYNWYYWFCAMGWSF